MSPKLHMKRWCASEPHRKEISNTGGSGSADTMETVCGARGKDHPTRLHACQRERSKDKLATVYPSVDNQTLL